MPLNLIIGRSNTGKTKLMYEKIQSLEKSNKNVILFVPDIARIVAEEEYFLYTNNKGMINTKITTITRYAASLIDKKKMYENKTFLPEMSKKFIVKKMVLDNSGDLRIFNKVKNTQGFADKVYKLLNSFESQQINESTLQEILSKETFLAQKFKEIYEMYENIKLATNERFVTSFEELDYFIVQEKENLKQQKDTFYFFDHYNNFSKKEMEYINTLILEKKDVTITLDLDMQRADLSDIFGVSQDTYNKLKSLCINSGENFSEIILDTNANVTSALDYTRQEIFTLGAPKTSLKDSTVNIRLLRNPKEEIEFIAQNIISKIKEGKYRFKDFKIYYNNSQLYDLNFQRVFNSYNIPFYINGTHSAKGNSLTIYLENLMQQILKGFDTSSMENIIQILKTGLTEFDAQDIYMFENYINEFGIKAYKLRHPLDKNNKEESGNIVYDIDKLNYIRDKIYSTISSLKVSLDDINNTKEIANVIYTHLHEAGVLNAYLLELQQIKEENIDEYNRKKQIIEHVYNIMDNIAIAFDTLDFATYVQLFIYGMQNMELKSIPPLIDQVEICDIDSTRSLPRSIVYIIGAFENGLPVISNAEGIFTDKEIKELEELGIEIAKTSESRNSMALFNVYKAINSCKDELYITIPSTKITGENLRLSPIIFRIKDILDIDVEGNITNDLEYSNLNIENIYKQFIQNLDEENENVDKLYKMLMEDEKYASILTYVRENKNLNEETVNKLYNKDLMSSVSRLEKFNACPFNYFATYILKLKEKKEYKLSVLDMGNIMHKVLEDISRFLLEKAKGFEDILVDEKLYELVKNKINKVLDEVFENTYVKYESSARYAYLKQKLKKGMLNIITYLSKSFMQSEFRPLGFEIEFEQGKLFAPIEICLKNGSKMYLRGKIDRVDTAKIKENIYLRVVDYKSSSKDLKLSDVKEGVSLQLMTYMWALLHNSEKIDKNLKVIPAAASYFTLNTDLLNLSECVNEQKISEKLIEKMKMKGIYLNDVEVLAKLDNKFSESKMSYIEMTSKKLSNKEKSLLEENFVNECKNVGNILSKIGSELIKGVVEPKESETNCKYCKYEGVCKKNLKAL